MFSITVLSLSKENIEPNDLMLPNPLEKKPLIVGNLFDRKVVISLNVCMSLILISSSFDLRLSMILLSLSKVKKLFIEFQFALKNFVIFGKFVQRKALIVSINPVTLLVIVPRSLEPSSV